MDNLRCHKMDGVRKAIEGSGAELVYLPPYSLDLNPIEMLWFKIKAILRKMKTFRGYREFSKISGSFSSSGDEKSGNVDAKAGIFLAGKWYNEVGKKRNGYLKGGFVHAFRDE